MKAIIIEDKDAKALIDKLKLESLVAEYPPGGNNVKDLIIDIHRRFRYEVVAWLQAQGCDLK